MKLVLAGICAAVVLLTGCVTSKVQQVDPTTGMTNTVTVVNSGNLALDCAAVQVATAVGVTAALNATHSDAATITALKNAQVALGGILNGTNPQTTQQVIDILNANGNPALSAQVTSLVQSISAAEQTLLAKYGAGVAGQITLALTKSVYSGLTVGLAGH